MKEDIRWYVFEHFMRCESDLVTVIRRNTHTRELREAVLRASELCWYRLVHATMRAYCRMAFANLAVPSFVVAVIVVTKFKPALVAPLFRVLLFEDG